MLDAVITQTVASTDGVQIALHEFGGTGPTLIVCHATGFHGRAYAPLIAALTPYFSVFALDFRGHGASTVPDSGDMAWQGMADDLLACLDVIDADSVVAFGHSMGGAAIMLAELGRPGAFAAAFVYEPIVFPAGFFDEPRQNRLAEPTRRRRNVFASKQAALDRYGSRPPLGSFHPDALAAYVEHGFVPTGTGEEVRLACPPEIEALTYEADVGVTVDRFADISLPLVVAAGGEHGGAADFGPVVAGAVASATYVEYEDLSHFGPFEAPDRLATDILKSLRSG